MSLIDLIPGGAQARGALMAGAAILTFGAGVAAAEAWERVLPWGLGPRLERLQESLPKRDAERYSAGATTQKALDEAVVESQWRPALAQCQSQRLEASQTVAERLAAEQAAARRSSDAAYRLGRASCGGEKSEKIPSGSGAAPGGGRVQSGQDFRDFVAGSLRPAP